MKSTSSQDIFGKLPFRNNNNDIPLTEILFNKMIVELSFTSQNNSFIFKSTPQNGQNAQWAKVQN